MISRGMRSGLLRALSSLAGSAVLLVSLTACPAGNNKPIPVPTANPSSEVVFVGDAGTGNVDALDEKTFQRVASFHVGGDPVAFYQDYQSPNLYVLDKANNRVDVVDTRTNTVTTTIPTGNTPVAMAYMTGGIPGLFVANEGDGTLTKISTETNTVMKTSVPLRHTPIAIYALGDGVTTLNTDNTLTDMSGDDTTLGDNLSVEVTFTGSPVAGMASGYDYTGSNYDIFVSQQGTQNDVAGAAYSQNSYSYSGIGKVTMTEGPSALTIIASSSSNATNLLTVDSQTNHLTPVQFSGGTAQSLPDIAVGADPVAVLSDNQRGITYVADKGDDTIDVVSNPSLSVIETTHLDTGSQPVSLGFGFDWYLAPPASPSPSPSPTTSPTVAPTSTPTVRPTSTPTVAPTGTPTPTPTPVTYSNTTLYVANGQSANVMAFAAPQSATESPSIVTMPGYGTDVATDGHGTLAVAANSNIYLYTGPLKSTSSPFATLYTGNNDFVAFDEFGNMFATTFTNAVYEYTKPFTSTEQPKLMYPGSSTAGIAIDGSGTLYIADKGNIDVVTAPYGSSNITHVAAAGTGDSLAGAVISQGNLYVSDTANQEIYAYNLPLSSASTPYATWTVQDPEALTVDASGNLYVSNEVANRVDVYSAPTPQSTILNLSYSLTSTYMQSPFGLTFGP